MKLSELVRHIPGARVMGEDVEVAGIALDSRAAKGGELFAALPGVKTDGRAHAADAVRRGAAAVLAEGPVAGLDKPLVLVDNARKAASEAAAALAGFPADRLQLVGVTGTNGKTTTAYLLRHILNRAGRRCGMLGRLNTTTGGTSAPRP